MYIKCGSEMNKPRECLVRHS